MNEEELFKKNFPEYVTEKGMCLSPYWDLFNAGIECATYELNSRRMGKRKYRLCKNCQFLKS